MQPEQPDTTTQERRRRRDAVDWPRSLTLAVGVAGGLLLAGLLGAAFGRLQNLILVLLISVFLSFGMEPAVQWLQQRGMRRGAGTGLVFLVTIASLGAFAIAMTALVSSQVTTLVAQGPELLDDLAARVAALPEPVGPSAARLLEEQAIQLPDRLEDAAAALGRGALGLGTTLIGGVLDALTILLVTFYLVADGPRLRRTLSGRLEPRAQGELLAVWELAIGKTGGYVYSRALTAVVSSVVHVVAFTLLDLPYPLALGLWVGLVSSLIPVVGTYLAGALPLVVGLATDPGTAVLVLVTIVLYQQVENYLVAPRLTERALQLHPAVAFVSVLVGGSLLGAVGALLALPVTAIIAALVQSYGSRHELLDHDLLRATMPRDVLWASDAVRGRGGGGGGTDDTAPTRPRRPRRTGGATGPGPGDAHEAPGPADAPGAADQAEGRTTTNVES